MALPTNADVRFLLSRIRAGAEYGWQGGAPNDFTLVDWRDLIQTEPTEADYLAEQTVVDAEVATEATTRTAQTGRSAILIGNSAAGLNSVPEIQAAVEELLFRFGALDINGVIRPLDEWKTL